MLRVLIMGVSGCGKSRVGVGLSTRLGVPFVEGDELHPAANIAKMRSGTPLTDDDRWPWLDQVAGTLSKRAPVIVSCSALKREYRNRIRIGAGGPVRIIYLCGSKDTIATRLAARKGHFMPASLLDSQFATLEPPDPGEALTVDISGPVEALVELIASSLQQPAASPMLAAAQ